MTLPIPVVWSDDCLRHDPAGEVWLGVREPGTETPTRAQALRDALAAAGAPFMPARPHDDAVLARVHDQPLLDHLAGIWAAWEAGGYPAEHGRDRVVPYVFPTAGMLAGLPPCDPPAPHGRVGRYCYDTMTLIGPGSWEAIRGAADAALTAADLVASGAHRTAYALCRPPGHHATRAAYGGSCYLNNAALAAQSLRDAGAAVVAIIDIDAHHGNGTQMIFYDRADVRYGSVHVDPGAGWFPHYAGHAEERGIGDGSGANRNLPLAPGAGDPEWLDAVGLLCADAAGADAVVVSLGLDAAESDPESPLRVSHDAYRAACAQIAALAPTVLVQEGGYDLSAIGPFAVAALSGAVTGVRGGAG